MPAMRADGMEKPWIEKGFAVATILANGALFGIRKFPVGAQCIMHEYQRDWWCQVSDSSRRPTAYWFGQVI
jgi:hypothetical protein